MKPFNPFYDALKKKEITHPVHSDMAVTCYIQTGNRRKLNQAIVSYFGFTHRESTTMANSEIITCIPNATSNPTKIGTQTFIFPTGWCLMDVNTYKKLKDFGTFISLELQTVFIQTALFHPSDYAYFLVYENGKMIREIENSNMRKRPHINWGQRLSFEEAESTYFSFDDIDEYLYTLKLELHLANIGSYYSVFS